LHFNKRIIAAATNNINENNLVGSAYQSASLSRDNSKVISIDTITLDRHSRLTLTKRVKDVFPIEPGDKIAVYQNTGKISNELIFEVQRRNSIVDVWVMKRNTIGVSTTDYKPTITSNPQQGYHLDHDKNRRYSNIMIIDDEPDLLVAFKSILSTEGYHVETFSDSHEALKRFLEVKMTNNKPSTISSHYDLIITDIRMPGLNGIQLYQILKALSADVKILFISALDAAQEVVSALPAVRPSDIIQKPVETEHFIKKINEVIIS
jgi:CheY-like chemotaxis protein